MDIVQLVIRVIVVGTVLAIGTWLVRKNGIVIPQPFLYVLYAIIAIVAILLLVRVAGPAPVLVR